MRRGLRQNMFWLVCRQHTVLWSVTANIDGRAMPSMCTRLRPHLCRKPKQISLRSRRAKAQTLAPLVPPRLLASLEMLQAAFKVAQRVPAGTTQLVPYRSVYSFEKPSLFTQIRRKLNKIFLGTETPRKQRDPILEKIIEEEKYYMPAHLAKTYYVRDIARKNYLRHNERIRELEHKVTGGLYKVKGFANKF